MGKNLIQQSLLEFQDHNIVFLKMTKLLKCVHRGTQEPKIHYLVKEKRK